MATAPCGLADPKSDEEEERRDDPALKKYFTPSFHVHSSSNEIHHAPQVEVYGLCEVSQYIYNNV